MLKTLGTVLAVMMRANQNLAMLILIVLVGFNGGMCETIYSMGEAVMEAWCVDEAQVAEFSGSKKTMYGPTARARRRLGKRTAVRVERCAGSVSHAPGQGGSSTSAPV